jgi:hypothetical protein
MASATAFALCFLCPGIALPRTPNPWVYSPELPQRKTFFFAQLVYGKDMSWNPYPTAGRSLMEALARRTSIPAGADRVDLRLSDPELFHYPFVCWTGAREFAPLSDADIERARTYLEFGGFMLVDDALSAPGVGFDKSFQRDLARLFPGESLGMLPKNHTIYQSYYLLDRAVGRTARRPYLSGISRDDRTLLVYSGNDLGGAWARERTGKWRHPVEPGGESQREAAIRLGVNIMMYALCVNYKKDLIHVPFISKRRKNRP